MIDGFRETNFLGAYYFADIIANILEDPLEHMAGLEAFCDGENAYSFLPPFPRKSALHCFAEYMIDILFWETDVEKYEAPDEPEFMRERFMVNLRGHSDRELWVEKALREHGLDFEPFTDWTQEPGALTEDAVFDWFSELRLTEEYDRLLHHLSRDVFSVLFANRGVLRNLNRLIANDLIDAGPPSEQDEDHGLRARYVTADGHVKRVDIPIWAKRAVFFRDRGRCCFCQRDLGGLLSPFADLAYDHIVPLAMGGINDVTNLQLLCGPCNGSKAARHDRASSFYGLWYDDRDDDDARPPGAVG